MIEVLYGFYIIYRAMCPIPALQVSDFPPHTIDRQIQTSNGSGIAGAKLTLFQAGQPTGVNWFPIQLNKIFETTSDANGIVHIPFDALPFSAYANDSNMVFCIESSGLGSVACPAHNLVDSNFPIVLFPAGSIAGRVIDQDGHPITGATVHYIANDPRTSYVEEAICASLPAFSTISDTLGRFEFHNVGRDYELRVFAAQQNMLQLYPWNIMNLDKLSMYSAGQRDIELIMQPARSILRGKALNSDTGQPIPAMGFILRKDGFALRTYSDNSGNFEFAADPCTYAIESMHNRPEVVCIDRREITIQKDQTITADMHFVHSGEVFFSGRQPDGNDANDFEVSCQYLDTGRKFSFRKFNLEEYPVKQAPRGKYRVLDIIRPGFKWIGDSNSFEVKPGKLTEITFTFRKASFTGYVRDKAGNPVPKVEIYVVPGSFPVITTSSDGSFEIPPDYLGKGLENLHPDRPNRLLVANDSKNNSGAIVPLEFKNDKLEVVVEKGATLYGRIIDQSGSPVGKADVWLTYHFWNMFEFDVVPRGDFVTDSNGNYSFTGLPAGNYFVNVSKTGFSKDRTHLYIENEPNGTKHVFDYYKPNHFKITRGLLHDLVLVPTDKVIEGQITTTDGEIFPKIDIKRDGEILAQTDDQGKYRITNVGTNAFKVDLEYGDPNYGDILYGYELDGSRPRNNIVIPTDTPRLGPEWRKPARIGGKLRILVCDKSTKAPLRKASIWIKGDNFVNTVQMPCKANGELELMLPEGKCNIGADAGGYFPSENKNNTTAIIRDQVQTVKIELGKKLGLSGIVLDVNGQPASNLQITVARPYIPHIITSSNDGSFKAEFRENALPDEPIWISIFSGEYGLVKSYASLPDKSVTLKCEQGVTVWGNVVDNNEIPITSTSLDIYLHFTEENLSLCSKLQVPIDEAGSYTVNLPMLPEGMKYEFNNCFPRTFLEPKDLAGKTELQLNLRMRKIVQLSPEQREQMQQKMKRLLEERKKRQSLHQY